MNRFCEVCGMADMVEGRASTLYCQNCGAQSTHYIEEAFDMEDGHLFNTAFVRERGVNRAKVKEQQPRPKVAEGILPEENLDDLQGLHDAILSQQETIDLSQLGSQYGLGSQFGKGSQFTQCYSAITDTSGSELASAIRKCYVDNLQKILQMQCECLVKNFAATPLICNIVGPVWLRFVASTRVFEKAWAEEAVMVAEHRERLRRGNQPPVSQGSKTSQPL
jgi:hypothetical protein